MSKAADKHSEQANRNALMGFTGVFLTQFGGLIIVNGETAGSDVIVTSGWKLELRREPSLRIEIRVFIPGFNEVVRDVLRTLNYTVNSMRDRNTGSDYLVALV